MERTHETAEADAVALVVEVDGVELTEDVVVPTMLVVLVERVDDVDCVPVEVTPVMLADEPDRDDDEEVASEDVPVDDEDALASRRAPQTPFEIGAPTDDFR